jgi:ribosomal protein L11 methyltransferase
MCQLDRTDHMLTTGEAERAGARRPFAVPCGMPYRLDICCPPPDALDLLVQWGALDLEPVPDGLAALLPDGVTPDTVTGALGGASVIVSAAVVRDNGSVWLLRPRAVQIGGILIVSPEAAASPEALRLTDAPAFGTGHHPTTALCVEALAEILTSERVESILDVGTGSGILALVALKLGVPQAVGLEIDAEALPVAAENACLNRLADRLQLVLGGPEAVEGHWPLVVANVLAAPLMDMAPLLVRRVGSRGRLILSGIPWSLASEVRQTYQHLGMQPIGSKTRAGWTALIAQASW